MITKHIIPATNFEVGRHGYKPEAVIIHFQQGNQQGTISWFKSSVSQVSSHYAISKLGIIDQFVDEVDTAYHSGRVSNAIWGGLKKNLIGSPINPNYYTVGIELEGFRGDTATEPQMKALIGLVKEISNRWGFYPKRANIVSHHEIAADKQNTSAICDEVVRWVNIPDPPKPIDKKAELVACLQRAIEIAKQLWRKKLSKVN